MERAENKRAATRCPDYRDARGRRASKSVSRILMDESYRQKRRFESARGAGRLGRRVSHRVRCPPLRQNPEGGQRIDRRRSPRPKCAARLLNGRAGVGPPESLREGFQFAISALPARLAEEFPLQHSFRRARFNRVLSGLGFEAARNAFDDINWTSFRFFVDAADIFTNHSREKEKHSREKRRHLVRGTVPAAMIQDTVI